jgi:hypothetical protein
MREKPRPWLVPDPVRYQDLPAIREALKAYRDYLTAHGKDGRDNLWLDKVKAGLRAEGFVVREDSPKTNVPASSLPATAPPDSDSPGGREDSRDV